MGLYDPLKAVWTTTILPSGVSGLALSVGDTLQQKVVKLNGWTVAAPDQDTTGTAVRGVLYPRGSWDRVQQCAIAPASVVSGGLSVAVQATVTSLVKLADQNAPVPMSIAAVKAKALADLNTLMTTKLSDGKGILWAAGELSAGDAGDSAVLIALLVNPTIPWSQANAMPTPLQAADPNLAGLN
jgi:hypothetical protein